MAECDPGVCGGELPVDLALVGVGMVGQVAERFGEDPRPWQLRMLPLTVFGPLVGWLVLSRRDGPGGPGGWA